MKKRFGPGRVRRKLAEMIVAEIKEPGISFSINPEDLIPNEGYWRTDYRADVMPWTGAVSVSRDGGKTWTMRWNVESWATMSDLIRFGFTYEMGGGCIELLAKNDTPHPAARMIRRP